MRISIVTLGVTDLLRSSEFYQTWFKTEPASASNDNIKFFNLNGTKLALFPQDELAKDAHISNEGQGFRGMTLAINADSKVEVDEIFAQGIKSGAKQIKKPESVFWGGYSGYLSDPDGHLWEIAWNPFFTKDKQGELMIP